MVLTLILIIETKTSASKDSKLKLKLAVSEGESFKAVTDNKTDATAVVTSVSAAAGKCLCNLLLVHR